MTKDPRYLTAREAATLLNISRETLYAYVSRGLVRSEEAVGKTRARRYHRADVEALLVRKERRRNPARVAEMALHWGDPVLPSALTLIDNGRFYYRRHDAIELAHARTFEEVAALLWTGAFDTASLFSQPMPAVLPDLPSSFTLMAQFQAALALVAPGDPAASNLSPQAVAQTGARILHWLTAAAAREPIRGTIAETLQQAWLPQQPEAVSLLNMALILCADHELNVSSFTARCVASAGATPYAVVMAGLAALSGSKHGGFTEQVAALLAEVDLPAQARAVVARRLQQGERLPGFDHKLYPEGDPRAVALLAAVTAVQGGHTAVIRAKTLAEVVYQANGQRPTVDFGLVTLAQAFSLPPGAALALFALGRTAGWLAHAIEQYQQPHLIRPRAKYVGKLPPPAGSQSG